MEVIFGPWGSETPEPIHLNLARLMTSTIRPNTQNMVAAENGGWGGHMGEVVPSRAFLFLVHSTRPQLTLSSVDFRSVYPKTCFGGGCVPLGSVCPGVKSSLFTPVEGKCRFSNNSQSETRI